MSLESIFQEIRVERGRQIEKWGVRNDPSVISLPVDQRCAIYGIPVESAARARCDTAFMNGTCTYADIAVEELSESVCAATPEAMRKELVQLATVICAWIDKIDRNGS